MKKLTVRSLILFFLFSLNACVSADMRQYGNIDPTDKTITVPAGGGLVADLKDILKQNGWKIIVDRGPEVMQGKNDKEVDMKLYGTFKTRYRLMLDARRFDLCLGHMDGAYNYNMSVVDNSTGEELMVMGGSACESQIKDKFEQFLNSNPQ